MKKGAKIEKHEYSSFVCDRAYQNPYLGLRVSVEQKVVWSSWARVQHFMFQLEHELVSMNQSSKRTKVQLFLKQIYFLEET